MARKIRSPEDEREGVETYSRYFGTKRVGWVLTSLLLLIALCAWALGSIIEFAQLYFWCIAFIFGLTSTVMFSFHRKATPRQAKNVEFYTSLYTLCVYAAIIVASMWTQSIIFMF
jgi:4-hydroxybenzoate polyprenyltransferase